MFSVLKMIKTKQRTNLRIDTLGDLEICVEGPTLSTFDATSDIELLWKRSTGHRVNQKPRKAYKPREKMWNRSWVWRKDQESAMTSFLDDWGDWFSVDSEWLVTWVRVN